ncbi:MAG: hypothetical protein GYA41_02895 [Bacteroidales bacterium]|nr:hypothetical protein [Bacteroidales bacterium]
MNYKVATSIIFLLCLCEITDAQQYSEKRTFRRSISVNKEMTLEINNKYGSVHISPSGSDSLTITAELHAFSSDEERASRMLQGISINISEAGHLVKAETRFSQTINMLLESFKGITKKIIPYDSRIEINYAVTAPEYLKLRITNRYGDVYIENCSGDLTLDLSNGSFKANNLMKRSQIRLNFCDASINRLSDGYIDASFSEVIIEESEDLSLTSLSSRYDLGKSARIDVKSRRDKFFIGTTGSVRGDSYFTDFRLDELGKEINLLAKYGRIDADLVNKNFEMININSSYTDIYLTFEPSASYNLDIRHINAFVTTPGSDSSLEKKVLNEEKKEYLTFGTVGKSPGDKKVNIEATKGNVYVK